MAGVTLVTHQGLGVRDQGSGSQGRVCSQVNQHEVVTLSTQGERFSKKLGKWSRIEAGRERDESSFKGTCHGVSCYASSPLTTYC